MTSMASGGAGGSGSGGAAMVASVASGGAVATSSDSAGALPGSSSAGAGGTAVGGSSGAGGGIMNPVPEAQAAESGDRLKARWRVASDGAREFVGWYDSERKENCTFILAADGSTRCMPSGGGAFYFSDDTCTDPLFIGAAGCEIQYGVRSVSGSCAGGTELHTVAPFSGTAYQGSPDLCVEVTLSDTADYYRSTGVIPPTSFVAASEEVDG